MNRTELHFIVANGHGPVLLLSGNVAAVANDEPHALQSCFQNRARAADIETHKALPFGIIFAAFFKVETSLIIK